MKVKICGLTRAEDAELAVSLGADALGFILYRGSRRYINPENVKNIINRLPPFVLKVGVFVNEDYELVNEIGKKTGINIVQLHGDETPEYVENIQYPVIKAFRVDSKFNYEILDDYDNCYYLLDGYDEYSYGGTGKKFDWTGIPENKRNKIILAGGIAADDLEIINAKVSPYAVDISSSIENEPGKKDKDKLSYFFTKLEQIRKN